VEGAQLAGPDAEWLPPPPRAAAAGGGRRAAGRAAARTPRAGRGRRPARAPEGKRLARGDRVTVSRNVFIPLTNLCRDRCAYCTFAKTPDSPEAHTYTLDEVAGVVRGGVDTGR